MKPMRFNLPYPSLLKEAEAIEQRATLWASRIELLGSGAVKTRARLRNLILTGHSYALRLRAAHVVRNMK